MQRRNGLEKKSLVLMISCAFGVPAIVQAENKAEVLETKTVEVVSTTPLPGVGLPIQQIPASVQVVKGEEIRNQQSLSIADYMSQNMLGVNVNETQNNPFQPNVNFRGFTASPLLGTPQGLSVYQDGVRINEPFGDVVSWDLIPLNAIASMSMMPGSNPLFGLNTLGGAISLQTKRGRTDSGGVVEFSAGSWDRYNGQVEYGGVAGNVDYYLAGNYFDEEGWRDASPSEVRQLFGQLGWQNETTDLNFNISLADNDLIGNGLVQREFLDAQDWESINTKPDQTENRMVFLSLNGSHWLSDKTMFSGNVYYRRVRTSTLNGDVNDDVDPATFAADCAGSASAETDCGGALNRSGSKRTGYGVTAQLTFDQDFMGHKNQFVFGGGYDYGRTNFNQNTEYGNITGSRGVAGIGEFNDLDEQVDLRGENRTWSLFATDTFTINPMWHLTLSGRYNHTKVDNKDKLDGIAHPVGDDESLTAEHKFNRFNPAVGLTFNPNAALSFYGSYNEGSRAPTAIELGCANPDEPCKLPNAMAGDPALDMVVSRTWEGGVRGKVNSGVGYSASIYRTQNTDDIQFIASNSSGAGYFDNVGKTRRIGADLGVNGDVGKFRWFAGYSYVKATYESRFDLVNEVNNSVVTKGGVDVIEVKSGDNIPGIPNHQFKFRGEWQALQNWTIGTNVVAFSDQYAHGNENNDDHGHGAKLGGYAVVNLDTRYLLGDTGWQVFAKVNNVFDKEYYSGGMLGETFFEPDGTFMDGDDDRSSLVSPGAPRAGWIGVRYEFGKTKGSGRRLDLD